MKCESGVYSIMANPRQKWFVNKSQWAKWCWSPDFDCWRMIYRPVHPPKTQISKEYYKMILEKLLDHIRQKWLEFLRQWIHHLDNARPHTAALLQEWLECHNIEVMKYPPYCPDLVLCNFWLFLSLKCELHGHHLETDTQVIQETQMIFGRIPKE